MNYIGKYTLVGVLTMMNIGMSAQTFHHYSTTDDSRWQKCQDIKAGKAIGNPTITTDVDNPIVIFRNWGTTFNEQDWKALCQLTRDEQDEILQRAFSPDGELKFSIGRISMNANDYALSWYACSEVDGDFNLDQFNIERDKLTIIPYIHAAQKYNPQMTFWMSPWSPPAWMKINHHYAVRSDRYNNLDPRLDHLLYEGKSVEDPDKNIFPRKLAVQDYFIQDPRYLQCYADMFSKFIDLYGEQGVPITMAMYQNEAYSYTPYPGCAWTEDGIIRFNTEYLAPTLSKTHPEVELCLGTFNTNRYDHVKSLLSNPEIASMIKGVGFQWEGGQILPRIQKEHPEYRYISSESECGNGDMDWKAAEHTFHLINHYIGNGCNEYNNWNMVLCDHGESAWGWKQNALVRVNSVDRSYEYVPEWFAYRHYSQFIQNGAKIIGFKPSGDDKSPILAALTPENKYVIVVGNFSDENRTQLIGLGDKTLEVSVEPHSFHTFVQK